MAGPTANPPSTGGGSERERRILGAAAEAFHELGFHGVGVDEIGRRAGLSGPALYRHFAGKDALLATLLDQAMDRLLDALETTSRPVDDLRTAVGHHLRFALDQRHLVGLYQRESRFLADPWAASFARRVAEYTRRWERLVARVLPAASAEEVTVATQATLGLVFSLPSWPEAARRVPDVEELTTRILMNGVLPGAPGS